jgi:hypothetical protein
VLEGSGKYEAALAAPCTLSPETRRTYVHHFLMVLGQAYSVHRNFQMRNDVRLRTGVALRAALERLIDALSDTSASLMNLVPGITVTPEPPASMRTAGLQGDGHEDPSGGSPHTAYAVVMLSNQGSLPAELTKIGLDRGSLPRGVTCDPAEPALFGTLGAGQTARATFVLRWKDPAVLPAGRCAGDISYFSAGAPAHLRPRTWLAAAGRRD